MKNAEKLICLDTLFKFPTKKTTEHADKKHHEMNGKKLKL